MFTSEAHFLVQNIAPHVFERALSIASDISREGREVKSEGCLFAIDDFEKIKEFGKRLIPSSLFRLRIKQTQYFTAMDRRNGKGIFDE
jgi:hypothetical protein